VTPDPAVAPAPPAQPAAPAQERPQEQAPAQRTRQTYTKLRPRFGLAYLLLAVVVGAAVGGLVVYLGNRDTGSDASWSTWKPALHGQAAWKEIGDHVAQQYRLTDGRQIVGVIPTPAQAQSQQGTIPVRAALITSGLPDERVGDIKFLEIKNGTMYGMCGLGTDCSIPGTATNIRGALIRREALELALYTFKYDGSVDTVMVFPPSPAGSQLNRTIFFRRTDLKTELSKPLADTISPIAKIDTKKLLPAERDRVLRLTSPHVYNYEYRLAQDGSVAMVLTPPEQ
jgi:hypothetical protein